MQSTRVIAALAILAGSAAAHAAPITVDFTVTSTTNSSPSYAPGVVGSGYFSFDDSLIPVGGDGVVTNPVNGLPTLDLSFSWYGVTFDELSAKISRLVFGAGQLLDWQIGGDYAVECGLFNRYSCVHGGTSEPDFYVLVQQAGESFATFNDGEHPGFASANDTVEWSVRAVPEPATLALLAMALAALRLFRLGPRLSGRQALGS